MKRHHVVGGIWGFALGAVVLGILGFSWLGWHGPGATKQMADLAVVQALVPVCVAQAQTEPAKLVELATITSSSQRKDFVLGTGWAPNLTVADFCAREILKLPATEAAAG